MASWIRGGETGERPTTVSWIRQQESAPGKPAPTRNKSGWNETRSPPLTPWLDLGSRCMWYTGWALIVVPWLSWPWYSSISRVWRRRDAVVQ